MWGRVARFAPCGREPGPTGCGFNNCLQYNRFGMRYRNAPNGVAGESATPMQHSGIGNHSAKGLGVGAGNKRAPRDPGLSRDGDRRRYFISWLSSQVPMPVPSASPASASQVPIPDIPSNLPKPA
jgi:hypothetical protein